MVLLTHSLCILCHVWGEGKTSYWPLKTCRATLFICFIKKSSGLPQGLIIWLNWCQSRPTSAPCCYFWVWQLHNTNTISHSCSQTDCTLYHLVTYSRNIKYWSCGTKKNKLCKWVENERTYRWCNNRLFCPNNVYYFNKWSIIFRCSIMYFL